MTKKDYELIARAVADVHFAIGADSDTVRAVAQRLAVRLADDNPRFDPTTFRRACTQSIDLSGIDYIKQLGDNYVARRNREQDRADRVA